MAELEQFHEAPSIIKVLILNIMYLIVKNIRCVLQK
jgi:hypothetical protein